MSTVILKTFDNYFSANIIAAKLEDAGVECFLMNEYSATIYPVLSNAIGGIKLAVNTNDAEKAIELLIHFEEEFLATIICPDCGNVGLKSVTSLAKRNLIENFLAKLFFQNHVSASNIYQCSACGYQNKNIPQTLV